MVGRAGRRHDVVARKRLQSIMQSNAVSCRAGALLPHLGRVDGIAESGQHARLGSNSEVTASPRHHRVIRVAARLPRWSVCSDSGPANARRR
jgi:hypothetical protein